METKDKNLVSSCCGMPVYSNTDICSDCKEHCTPEDNPEICEHCGYLLEEGACFYCKMD